MPSKENTNRVFLRVFIFSRLVLVGSMVIVLVVIPRAGSRGGSDAETTTTTAAPLNLGR